jgi:uncharacterized membrane protein YbhN (UPF0104 family)
MLEIDFSAATSSTTLSVPPGGLGATEVHACTLHLADAPSLVDDFAFDSYRALVVERSASAQPALAIRP